MSPLNSAALNVLRRGVLGALLATAPAISQAGTITGSLTVSGAADAERTVVYVESVPEGRFDARKAKLSQKGARFSPAVLPVVRGSGVDVTNDDWVAHSVFSKSEVKPFDLGVYSPGSVKTVSFERQGVVELFCAIHPRMNAVVLVLQNPFFAKPDAQGQFTIEGVPAGSYSLKLYRFGGKAATQQLAVPATGRVNVKF